MGPYGCGKTMAGILWAMKKSVENPGSRGMWVAPTFGMVKDILIPELEQYLSALGFNEATNGKRALRATEFLLTRSGRPELELQFHRWLLRSAEVPSRLKGPTLSWVLIDEADLVEREVEEIAISRVRDPGAAVLGVAHVGTPEVYGSWLQERVEGDAAHAGDMVVRARREDVTGLPPEYYARMRESFDEATFEQYAGGKWVVRTEGLIYTPPFSDANVRACKARDGLPILVGMDFNVDPFSFVVGHDLGGTLEIVAQYRLSGATSQLAADTLQADFPGRRIIVWCDEAGNQRRTSGLTGTDIQILRAAGLEVHWTHVQRVNNRYNSTRAMLQNAKGERRLFIDPSCKQLIRELRTLTHEAASKAGADNHTTSALDYLTLGHFNPVFRSREVVQPPPPRRIQTY